MRALSMKTYRWSAALCLAVTVWWPQQAFALFDDDEARKAIIELRNKFEASRGASEAALAAAREDLASSQKNMLTLSNQIEQMREEIARLRGQNEQLTRDVSELQRAQQSAQQSTPEVIDQQQRASEAPRVAVDGREFTASPAEKAEFDQALQTLRRADFPAAASAFSGFLQRYSDSGYTPSALYWLGNAQYANRAYKEALQSHNRLVTQFPGHLRTPEAMLAMANSYIELKDSKAARKMLESLTALHPSSEAAGTGRERLARLR